eukprot:1341068-Amorphochlora_amoeboformis.AAC.2
MSLTYVDQRIPIQATSASPANSGANFRGISVEYEAGAFEAAFLAVCQEMDYCRPAHISSVF